MNIKQNIESHSHVLRIQGNSCETILLHRIFTTFLCRCHTAVTVPDTLRGSKIQIVMRFSIGQSGTEGILLIGQRPTMTSPSTYKTTLRLDVGKRLSDITAMTSPWNSPSVGKPSPALSPAVVFYSGTPESAGVRTPELVPRQNSVAPPSECNNNVHHYHQRNVVNPPTLRAVSVPASLHHDLQTFRSRSTCEEVGQQQRYSSDVVKVALAQPSSK